MRKNEWKKDKCVCAVCSHMGKSCSFIHKFVILQLNSNWFVNFDAGSWEMSCNESIIFYVACRHIKADKEKNGLPKGTFNELSPISSKTKRTHHHAHVLEVWRKRNIRKYIRKINSKRHHNHGGRAVLVYSFFGRYANASASNVRRLQASAQWLFLAQ